MDKNKLLPADAARAEALSAGKAKAKQQAKPNETGGPKRLEPTRYGDWEHKGIASDF